MEVAVFALVPVLAVIAAVTWVAWQALRGLHWILLWIFRGAGVVGRRAARFVSAEFVEVIQLAGGLLTAEALSSLGVAEVAALFGQDLEHPLRAELMRLFTRALNDLGLGIQEVVGRGE